MKSILNLLLSILLLVFFGGIAWFFWESSSKLKITEKKDRTTHTHAEIAPSPPTNN